MGVTFSDAHIKKDANPTQTTRLPSDDGRLSGSVYIQQQRREISSKFGSLSVSHTRPHHVNPFMHPGKINALVVEHVVEHVAP